MNGRKVLGIFSADGWLLAVGVFAVFGGRDGKAWAMRLAEARDGR